MYTFPLLLLLLAAPAVLWNFSNPKQPARTARLALSPVQGQALAPIALLAHSSKFSTTGRDESCPQLPLK
jgi:hypothetical protein